MWIFTAHSVLLSLLTAHSCFWTVPQMHCLFQMEFWLTWDRAALAICCQQTRDEAPQHQWSFLSAPKERRGAKPHSPYPDLPCRFPPSICTLFTTPGFLQDVWLSQLVPNVGSALVCMFQYNRKALLLLWTWHPRQNSNYIKNPVATPTDASISGRCSALLLNSLSSRQIGVWNYNYTRYF